MRLDIFPWGLTFSYGLHLSPCAWVKVLTMIVTDGKTAPCAGSALHAVAVPILQLIGIQKLSLFAVSRRNVRYATARGVILILLGTDAVATLFH